MRLVLWALVVVGGCRFNTSGLAPSGDLSGRPTDGAVERRASADLGPDAPGDLSRPADLTADAPRLSDTRLEARPPDTRPSDTRPPDTRPPDTRPPDTASPCVSDHFLAATGWKLTVIKGSWSWLTPTYARHQLPATGYNVGEAQIQGSASMLGATVVGSAALTLKAVYQNGNSHGAGLALLIQANASSSNADKLVACVTKQSSSTATSSGAGIWYFPGSSNSATSLASGASLGVSLINKPATITMTLVPSGGTWTMSCKVEADGKQSSASAAFTSYITAVPYGIALVTFGASSDFDSFSLCP